MNRGFALLGMIGLWSAASTSACADEEDLLQPNEVHAQVEDRVGLLLREADASVATSWSLLQRTTALAMLEQIVGSDTLAAEVVRRIATPLAIDAPRMNVDGAIAYLNERVLAADNYRGDGIYQLSPAALCAGAADASCLAQLAQLDLRVRAARVPPVGADQDSVAFALQVGRQHLEPLTITLTQVSLSSTLVSTSVTAALDLDVLQRTLDTFLADGVRGIPATALAGQLQLRLQSDHTGASFRVALDRPISIRVAGSGGDFEAPDAFALTSQLSAFTKAFDLVLLSKEQTGTLDLFLGQTALQLPAGSDGKRVGLDLAGFSASAALSPTQPLAVAFVGLGGRPAKVTVDGVTAQTLELVPDTGDLGIFAERGATPDAVKHLHFVPKLDLRLTTDHAALGDAPPPYDVMRVSFDGMASSTASPDRLELTEGSYSIATDGFSDFHASAGQCVTSSPATADNGAHFTRWTVGACN